MIANLRRAAVVAALVLGAAPAGAVNIDANGTGQVLIYPYYTVNKNQDTLLTLVNSSDVGKVVKVRAREGYNGRAVLQFNLFLSAWDSWSASISALGDAGTGARMNSSDHSCTSGFTSPQSFVSSAYDGTSNDSGPSNIARTREGFIEVIAMADVIGGTELDNAMIPRTTGIPGAGSPDCGNAVFHSDDALVSDLFTPTTGLYGSAGIINVGQGTYYPYNAVAITGFYDIPDATLYSAPGDAQPTLQSARNALVPGGARTRISTPSGGTLFIDYVPGNDAVSAILTADMLRNDFLASTGLGATTDWVVTLPTKHFHVDQQSFPDAALAPFGHAFANGSADAGGLYRMFDRESGRFSLNCDPPTPNCLLQTNLRFETNVIEISRADAPTNVLGSALSSQMEAFGDSGWVQLDFSAGYALPGGRSGTSNIVLHGLPVTGFMVYNVINANAQPGMLANYSGLFPHHTRISCTNESPYNVCY